MLTFVRLPRPAQRQITASGRVIWGRSGSAVGKGGEDSAEPHGRGQGRAGQLPAGEAHELMAASRRSSGSAGPATTPGAEHRESRNHAGRPGRLVVLAAAMAGGPIEDVTSSPRGH